MSDSASSNILQAISKLDSSMANMVEQDPEKVEALYGAIRLQIENIEAKVSTLVEDKEDIDKDKIEDHFYWGKIEEAEDFYDNNKPLEVGQLRKYMSMRLEAIYSLLSKQGVYNVVTDFDTDDLDVIQPRDMEEPEEA